MNPLRPPTGGVATRDGPPGKRCLNHGMSGGASGGTSGGGPVGPRARVPLPAVGLKPRRAVTLFGTQPTGEVPHHPMEPQGPFFGEFDVFAPSILWIQRVRDEAGF